MEAVEQSALKQPYHSRIYIERRQFKTDLGELKKASVSDEQIDHQATQLAIRQYKESPFRKAAMGVALTVSVLDSVVEGALTNSVKVADKMRGSLEKAKNWGIILVGAAGINEAANFMIKKVPPLRKFKEENPELTSLGVMAGAAFAAMKAVNPVNSLLSDISGDRLKNIVKNTLEKVPDSVDRMVFKPVEKAVTHPVGNTLFKFGPIAILGGILIKNIQDASKAREKKAQIAQNLQAERFKNLLNIAGKSSVQKTEICISSKEP